MRALSLFSNIGVAEAYLEEIGIEVVVANEMVKRRAELYSAIYPNTNMICGDILEKDIQEKIVKESIKKKIDVIIATPPCQGISRAGHQKEDDERNKLILPTVDLILRIEPRYVFFENVSLFYETYITHKNEKILISDYIKRKLSDQYNIDEFNINTKDYSVPQTRERAIVLMTNRKEKKVWKLPDPDSYVVTLEDAIGSLPSLDPYIKDVSEDERNTIFPDYYKKKEIALGVSKWHNPPEHIKRQVIVMMHTPSGCTAFDNAKYKPVKANGELVRGYKSTYRRLRWKDPASTVTMDNRKISSQNNVHPGRYLGVDENGDVLYSDARALTVYELMKISSIPDNWNIPIDTPEAFLRSVIGEGIPPLFVKKVFENLI